MSDTRRTVTGLRALRPGRVAVELDGALWRTLPLDVVVRVGLSVGEELDRARLRLLRRELRRHETLAVALRTLRSRDHSVRELDEKLQRRGAHADDRRSALDTLERAGLVDEDRFAESRAQRLAERGWGDAAIRDDLARRGVEAQIVEAALAGVDPERERAAVLAARRGGGARAARWLAARGFGEEALETVIAEEGDSALP